MYYILVILKTCFKGCKNKTPVFPWVGVSRWAFLLSGKDSGILLQLLHAVKVTLVSFSSLNSLLTGQFIKELPFPPCRWGVLFSHFFSPVMTELDIIVAIQPNPGVHVFKSNWAGRRGRQKLIDIHPMRLTVLSSIWYLALNPTELDLTHGFQV